MRLAQTQVWPACGILEAIAPLTAISISASSKTMDDALPPNSSDNFLTVPVHCCISGAQSEDVPAIVRTMAHRWEETMGEWANFSRRDLLFGTAAAPVGLAAFGPSRLNSAEAQTMAKPNILFILADDLGFADV